MPTKHVIRQIEAYLDNQLSSEQRRYVEEHLAICPTCTHYLLDARRLVNQLGPVMKKALGQPVPPPALRYRISHTLDATAVSPRPPFNWTIPGRIFNTVGTIGIIVLLAFGVFIVVQNRLPGNEISLEVNPLQPSEDADEGMVKTTNTSVPTISPSPTATSDQKISSLGDTLPKLTPVPVKSTNDSRIITRVVSATPAPITPKYFPTSLEEKVTLPISEPTGTIAFSFFNTASERQAYEIHLINVDGTNHRIFPLGGVSEPALRSTSDGYQLSYRAWGNPTSPRGLSSSGLNGERPDVISRYWEDAQPDWSPTENRIIFASQREGDRRWRLYTGWGDGSLEINLRREGKSPTFAPDGYRFAFESCDASGNRCGLWVGDLDNSEHNSKPFLEDTLAHSPDWSPVAEQIAYMANPHDNWDLYLVNSDGSNIRRLTNSETIEGLPVWSPEGEWLAFLSNRNENWGIWLLHVDSGQLRQIFDFDGGIFTPADHALYGQRQWWDEQLSWGQ